MQTYIMAEVLMLLYAVLVPQEQLVVARGHSKIFRNLVAPRRQDQFAGVHNQNPRKPCR